MQGRRSCKLETLFLDFDTSVCLSWGLSLFRLLHKPQLTNMSSLSYLVCCLCSNTPWKCMNDMSYYQNIDWNCYQSSQNESMNGQIQRINFFMPKIPNLCMFSLKDEANDILYFSFSQKIPLKKTNPSVVVLLSKPSAFLSAALGPNSISIRRDFIICWYVRVLGD